MNISPKNLDKNLNFTLSELQNDINIKLCDSGTELTILKSNNGLIIEKNRDKITVAYNRSCDFYRAIGLIIENNSKKSYKIEQVAFVAL